MRGISKEFLVAMRAGLRKGREKRRYGWDQRWEGVNFPDDPLSFFLKRLHEEIDELIVAISRNDKSQIVEEAADVANFAMFIADIAANSDWYLWE